MNSQLKNKLSVLIILLCLFSLVVKAQNTSLPVGAIPGSADVTSMGAATYNIPIEVVPGTQGMQPNLNIVYNSTVEAGLLGVKWSLSGISAITRTGQTFYHDNNRTAIQMNQNDRFCLDGNRLLVLEPYSYGASQATYYSEVEDFSRVVPYGTLGTGPEYFKVYADNGSVLEYGNTTDARQMAGNTVLVWYLNRVTDINGNYMTYTYGQSDGEVWIERIDYTGNDYAGLTTYASVEFEYESNNSSCNVRYVADYGFPQTKLLKHIWIKYSGNTVKRYTMNYESGSSVRLASVTEYGADGTPLNPTIVDWQEENLSIDVNTTTPFTESGKIISGDFDGDGFTDYILRHGVRTYGWKFYSGNGDNTFQLMSSGSFINPQVRPLTCSADIDGDGKDELIIAENETNSTIKFYAVDYRGTSYSTRTLFIAPYINTEQIIKDVLFADFDGNGKTDIALQYPKKMLVYIYDGQQYVEHSIANATTNIDASAVLDYDGDGIAELYVTRNITTSVYKYSFTTNHMKNVFNDGFPTKYHHPYYGDFNGDGITDVLVYSNRQWTMALGTGKGYYSWPLIPISMLSSNFVNPTQHSKPKFEPIIGDFNGDGKDDIMQVIYNSNTSRSNISVFFTKGFSNNTYLYESTMVNSALVNSDNRPCFQIGNVNGDNKIDVLFQHSIYFAPVSIIINEGSYPNYVSTISDGVGVQNKFHYSQLYYLANDFPAVLKRKMFPYLPDTLYQSSGIGESLNKISFNYTGPLFSYRRMSFYGFTFFSRHDEVSGHTTAVEYSLFNDKDIIAPHRITLFNQGLIKETIYAPQAVSPIGKSSIVIYSPQIVISNLLDEIVDTISSQLEPVDCRIASTVTKKHSMQSQETITCEQVSNTYTTVTGPCGTRATVLGSKTTTSTMQGSNLSMTTTEQYVYTEGRLHSKTVSDQLGVVTTEYSYNAYGLPISQTVSADGCQPRSQSFSYDEKGRFMVGTTNSLGHTSFKTFDPASGNVLSETDINGLVTNYSYDEFGRLTTINYPDGTLTQVLRKWYTKSEIPNARYYSFTSVSGQTFKTEQYYDLLGRNICTRKNGYYTDTRYNALGQVEKTSLPYIRGTSDANKIWNTYNYDLYGRIVNEQGPYTDLSHTYTGCSTTVTDNLRQVSTTKTTDAAGRIVLASDLGGQIQYGYTYATLDGQITLRTTATTNGHTTTTWSDSRGNRILLQDPDAGSNTYEYNAYGELVKQVDARGDTLKITYDNIGRIIQRQYVDNSGVARNIQYCYDYQDNQNKGLGKLHQVTMNDTIIELITYDNLSRPALHTRFIDATAFTETYSYNNYGQLATLTYPSGFATDFTYTGKGYLNEITRHDNEKQIFRAYNYNIFGQPTKCGYGNATATEYEYNTVGLLTRIKTGNKNYNPINPERPPIIGFEPIIASGGIETNSVTPNVFGELPFTVDSTIQNLRYRYDNVGRLIQRTQKNSQYETFLYDNLDRLTSFTQGTLNGVSQTFSTVYDAQGNILSNTLAGTYSYGSDKPHAVIEVTTDEAFPNAISPADCFTEYNVFNQPSRIAEGDVEILLEYGADNQRVKAVFKRNGVVERTRYYISANYEKEVDAAGVVTHYNYIYGATGLASICVRRNGVDSIYYVHPDRLGSYTHVTNSGKQVIRSLHFDPWGNVKSDADWTAFDTTTLSGNLAGTSRFDRGFTGHEHYADLKIINMNGRLYDPVIARFFSPDNFVQAPSFTQSYNRYAYCLNNPLQYTDPSGEFWHLIVGAAIGGFLNVVLNANNIDNCWQGLAYFGIGAVAGALSAGVGAGISTAFAGGSFSAGFTGITAGVSATGFLSGSASSAASGFIGGFITGSGNSWISGNSFSKGLINGITQGGIGLFVGSLTGGIIGGIDALYKGTNFWTGTASFDLSDNYGAIGKPIGEKTVTGKYVGKFEGVNLYEANIPEGSAATLPGRGIILSKGQYSIHSSSLYTKQLLQHEFGHILQARKVGMVAYYSIIAKESFISASFDGINGWSHDLFWTETWANYLSQNYFGANSLINSWPSQNISWFNYLRLLSANIIIP